MLVQSTNFPASKMKAEHYEPHHTNRENRTLYLDYMQSFSEPRLRYNLTILFCVFLKAALKWLFVRFS